MTPNEKLWDLFAKWDKIKDEFVASVEAGRSRRRIIEDVIRREGLDADDSSR